LHELAAFIRFLVVVCHRQWGKTTAAINECVTTVLFSTCERPRAAYLCPFRNQAKNVAWDCLKAMASVVPGVDFNETELRADFPNGGRVTLFGADNPDAMRGLALDLAVVDEFAYMDPRMWSEILRPALATRKGRALFIGTPCGRNHFHDLFERAESAEWGRVLHRSSESGVLSTEELASARRSMSEEEYAQEMECSWSSIVDGSIYGKLLDAAEQQGRIGDVPWNPSSLVHTAWDLGIGDSTVIWFIQRIGMTWRLIDHYEASGVGLSHYVKVLREKPYIFGAHVGPHDIEVSELGTGTTRREVARELGIDFTVAPRLPVDEGIDAVRRLLPQCWIDRAKCQRGLEALGGYRRQWDQQLRMFQQRPVHDWCSHSADALRTFATGFQEVPTQAREVKVISAFDPRMPLAGAPRMPW
jgi:hypothetical protein